MKTLNYILTGLLFAAGVVSTAPAASAPKPNILLIIADDLGHADVGFAGGKQIKTPNLDALAARGARLEQHYVQPVCSPTRAALLTGRYPMRYGLQVGVIRPWESRGLPLSEQLLPQGLKAAGYATAIIGKWHLGCFQPEYLPTRRGFDHQYGHYSGALDYNTHERDGGFDWHKDDKVCRDEGYTTHLVAQDAVRWLKELPANQPFFLYVPFNAVHAPHQVPEKYKEPYASLPEPRRTYAGMLAAMDEAIGQIVAAVDARGVRNNTLIIFSSDNGGPNPGKVTDNGPLRAGKGTVYEGGVRVCAMAAWDGKIKAGTSITQPIHAVDWYPTLLKLAGSPTVQKLPLDGADVWPVLTAGAKSPHASFLFNTTPKAGAVRVGDWKLVLNGGAPDQADDETPAPRRAARQAAAGKGPGGGIELFNLAADASEKNNLAASNPDKVKELRAVYDQYATQAAPPANSGRPAGFKTPKVWGEQ